VATAAKRGIARAATPSLGHKLTTARAGMLSLASTYTPSMLKYGTVGGVAYLVLNHPQVITVLQELLPVRHLTTSCADRCVGNYSFCSIMDDDHASTIFEVCFQALHVPENSNCRQNAASQ
jgi:hypothetical protein